MCTVYAQQDVKYRNHYVDKKTLSTGNHWVYIVNKMSSTGITRQLRRF